MACLVGIEIDWNVLRASVVDPLTNEVIGFDDQIVLAAASNGVVDPTAAVQSLWERLDISGPSARVAISLGSEIAGILPCENPADSASELADAFGVDLAWIELDKKVLAYVRADYLCMLVRAFRIAHIPLQRVDLAPVALGRVLKNDFSGAITLTSGAGWKVNFSRGAVSTADTSLKVLTEPGAKMVTKQSVKDLKRIRNVGVADELVERHQIPLSNLMIATGAALGLLDEGYGLISAEFAATTNPNTISSYEEMLAAPQVTTGDETSPLEEILSSLDILAGSVSSHSGNEQVPPATDVQEGIRKEVVKKPSISPPSVAAIHDDPPEVAKKKSSFFHRLLKN